MGDKDLYLNINFNQNQIKQGVIEVLSSPPTHTPKQGELYFSNDPNNMGLMVYNGTGWINTFYEHFIKNSGAVSFLNPVANTPPGIVEIVESLDITDEGHIENITFRELKIEDLGGAGQNHTHFTNDILFNGSDRLLASDANGNTIELPYETLLMLLGIYYGTIEDLENPIPDGPHMVWTAEDLINYIQNNVAVNSIDVTQTADDISIAIGEPSNFDIIEKANSSISGAYFPEHYDIVEDMSDIHDESTHPVTTSSDNSFDVVTNIVTNRGGHTREITKHINILSSLITELIKDEVTALDSTWSSDKISDYIGDVISGSMVYQDILYTGTPNENLPIVPPTPETGTTIKKGMVWIVEYDSYFGSQFIETGDMIIATEDNADSDEDKYKIINRNITIHNASETIRGIIKLISNDEIDDSIFLGSYDDESALTLRKLKYYIDNYLEIPIASQDTIGGVRLISDNKLNSISQPLTNITDRTYSIQLNDDNQMLVNIPWVNSEYVAGNGLTLLDNIFSLPINTSGSGNYISDVIQTENGLTIVKSDLPTYVVTRLRGTSSGVFVDGDLTLLAGDNVDILQAGTEFTISSIDTTYTAGNGLTLSGSVFSLPITISGTGSFVQSVTQSTNGLLVELGDPIDTTYTTDTLAILEEGTSITGALQSAKNLNDWLDGKNYLTNVDLDGYATESWVLSLDYISSGDNISELTNDVGYITSADLPIVNDAELTVETTDDLIGGFTFSANQSGNVSTTIGLSTTILDSILDGETAFSWGDHSGLYVPLSRTLTINGESFDLSSDRSWTIDNTITRIGSGLNDLSSGDIIIEGSGNTSVTKSGNTITISSGDIDTTYTAGNGITLVDTEFSQIITTIGSGSFVSNITQTDGGFQVTLGDPIDTTYTTDTLTILEEGTSIIGALQSAKNLNDWLDNKEFLTLVDLGGYATESWVIDQGYITSYVDTITRVGSTSSNATSGDIIIEGSGNTSVTKSGNTITISSGDIDTTYTAGNGITLVDTEFSQAIDIIGTGSFVSNITQTDGGFQVTLGNPIDTTYTTDTLTILEEGTSIIGALQTAKNLNDWLDGKNYLTNVDLDDYATESWVLSLGYISSGDNISELTNDVGYITSADLPIVNDGELVLETTSDLVGGFTFSANQSGNVSTTIGLSTTILESILDGETAFSWGDHSGLYVPLSRTLTINGESFDLSSDRAWTIDNTITRIGSDLNDLSSGDIIIEGSGNTSVSKTGNTITISSGDIDTTYTAGDGLVLNDTEFSQIITTTGSGSFISSITQTDSGFQVNLSTPPNTTYSTDTLTILNSGTSTDGALQTAKNLNDWLDGKEFLTLVDLSGYATESWVIDQGYITSYVDTITRVGSTSSNVTSGDIIIEGSGNTSVTKSGNTITISSGDTDTTYTAGNGLVLNDTEFSQAIDIIGTGSFVSNITQTDGGFQVTLGDPIDTTYTTDTLAILEEGTSITGALQSAKNLNDWLDGKNYLTSVNLNGYATESWVIDQGYITSYVDTITRVGSTSSNVTSGDIIIEGSGNTSVSKTGNIITINSNNTTYTAGDGLVLNDTEFSQIITTTGTGSFISSITQTDSGFQVTLGDPIDTTYTTDTLAILEEGTSVIGALQSAKNLNDWLSDKNYLTNVDLDGYVTESWVLNQYYISSGDNISELTNDVGYITSADLPIVNDAELTVETTDDLIGGFIFTANQSGNVSTTIGLSAEILSDITDGKTAFSWGDHSGLYVPLSRTLTINGESFDLSYDRAWTIDNTITRIGSDLNDLSSGDIIIEGSGNTSVSKTGNTITINSNNTTYTAGDGLVLNDTEFSQIITTTGSGSFISSITQTDSGFQVNLSTPPNTNTTYTAGDGLTLSGTTFSLPITYSGTGDYVSAVTQTTNGLTVTRANLPTFNDAITSISRDGINIPIVDKNVDIPLFSISGAGLVPERVGSTTTRYLREDGTWVVPSNTTYTNMSIGELNTGTATTGRIISASVLNSWLNDKSFATEAWVLGQGYITSYTDTITRLRGTTSGTFVDGDLTLLAGNNITITQSGSNITIASSNTTYTTDTLAILNAGTSTTGALQSSKNLNDWLDGKDYLTSTDLDGYATEAWVLGQGYSTQTLTAGTNISIVGGAINNTAPNITQVLNLVGSTLSLSNGGGSVNLPTYTDTITRLRGTTSGTFVDGDITLLAGANTTITQSGNNITIASSDTNTTYSAGTGISLSGTTFGQTITTSGTGTFVTSVTQTINGLQFNLGTPPNTSYTTDTLAILDAGTSTTGALQSSKNLNDWLSGKNYLTSVDLNGYATESWVLGQGYITNYVDTITRVGSTAGNVTSGDILIIGSGATSVSKSGNTITISSTNTAYTAGSGLTLSGTTFSLPITYSGTGNYVSAVAQTTNGLTVTRANLPTFNDAITSISRDGINIPIVDKNVDIPLFDTSGAGLVPERVGSTTTRYLREDGSWVIPTNTTYSNMSIGELNTGTATTGRIISASVLNSWLNDKSFATEAWVLGQGYITSYTDTITRLRGTTSGTFTSGDLTLLAGANTTITQSGSNITIASTNTNTTYSAGTGLTLSGTTFGQTITTSGTGTFVTSVTQTANGFQINLGTPPNTNTTYSNMSLSELNTGTVTTARTISAKTLNDWLDDKDYLTSTDLYGYATEAWVLNQDYITSADLLEVNDGQLTLSTGTGLSGSANFTANQSGNSSFDVEIASTHKLPTLVEWNALPTTNTITRLRGTTSGTYTSGDLTLLAGANTTITQSGSNITIASTNTNTTYSAGTGLSLSGTTFNVNYGTTAGTSAQGNDSRINNGQTAFDWGNHALAGYLTSTAVLTYSYRTSVPVSSNVYEVFKDNDFQPLTNAGTAHLYDVSLANGGDGTFGGNVGAARFIILYDTPNSTWVAHKISQGGGTSANIKIVSGIPVVEINNPASKRIYVNARKYSYMESSSSWIDFLGLGFDSIQNLPTTLEGYGITNAAKTTTQIVAGNGLSGGGSLATDRTISLGTPGAITLSTSNSVGTTSHTHEFAPGGTTAQYIRGDGSLATFPSIPSGTVTSIGMTTPTGLAVSPSTITSSGTFALTYSSGYQGYTTAEADKLAGLSNYVLPTASATVLGGIRIGSGLSINSSGVLSNSAPNVTQTLGLSGNTLSLSNGGGSVNLPTYTDTVTRLRGTTSGTYTSGDVTLLAGANTTITQSGANITIASTDTNTTYTAGTGLSLSGTTFGQAITTSGTGTFVTSITQTTNGFQINLGTPPNTNTTYSNMSLSELNTGTVTTARSISSKTLNDWLDGKDYLTSTDLDGYATEAWVLNQDYITSADLPEVNDGQLTLSTGTGLSGSANFTANQSGNSSFSVAVASTHKLPTTTEWNALSTQTLSSSTSNIISGSTVQRAALTGDVTASQNSNATTIANSAVTHAKYQNIATQRILGRGATGTGNVQELTLGSNLSLSTAGVLSATNTNTTYTAGNGLTLSGTTFSLPVTQSGSGNIVSSVVASTSGLTVTKTNISFNSLTDLPYFKNKEFEIISTNIVSNIVTLDVADNIYNDSVLVFINGIKLPKSKLSISGQTIQIDNTTLSYQIVVGDLVEVEYLFN